MRTASLCQICSPKQWKTISSDMLTESGYPVYGANGIIGCYSDYNHELPTLLITCRGATCGTLNISRPFSYINGNAMALDDLDSEIDLKYLYYFLQNRGFQDVITGSAQPQIVRQSLGKIIVSYPGLNAQKKITSTLDAIERLSLLRKQQVAKLDELVKSRFVEMFRNEATHSISLKDCCIDVRGGGTPSMQHPEYYGGNVPFIKSGDVRGDAVMSGALWLTERALKDTPAKYVPKGSVLVVNRSASLLHEFRASIAMQPVVINQDIKAFIPKLSFTSEYLLWAIKIQAQYLLTKVTTVLTSHIDLKDLLELQIVPASIERQTEFAQFVARVDKSKLVIQQSLEKLEILKKSLMQQYFG